MKSSEKNESWKNNKKISDRERGGEKSERDRVEKSSVQAQDTDPLCCHKRAED